MAHALEEGGQQQQQQQQEHQEEPDQLQQRQQAALGRVVFLFKLTEGVAPASFGIHVARMAQLPESVLHRAAAVAARVQEAAERRRQQRPQDGQAGVTAAAPSAAGLAGAAEDGDDEGLINLAQQCQQFLRHGLVAGLAEADAEAGRRLRQAARQLLSA
jgi:DNA mismatch repair ATPase MutS